MVLFHLFFLLCTTIWAKIRVIIDLFRLFANDSLTKIFGALSFIFSFAHDDSTKNQGHHWFIYFPCKRPFDQNIWSSFIYSFLMCATIRPKIRVLTYLFLLFVRDHSIKIRCHSYTFAHYIHDYMKSKPKSYCQLTNANVSKSSQVLYQAFLSYLKILD